jgi:hypothetical protein
MPPEPVPRVHATREGVLRPPIPVSRRGFQQKLVVVGPETANPVQPIGVDAAEHSRRLACRSIDADTQIFRILPNALRLASDGHRKVPWRARIPSILGMRGYGS